MKASVDMLSYIVPSCVAGERSTLMYLSGDSAEASPLSRELQGQRCGNLCLSFAGINGVALQLAVNLVGFA